MIDIIVPVYNTPVEALERCFMSFEKQTYKNWTAIIVDDGSQTKTAEWLDLWAKNHKKFRTEHKKNGGVSSARNLGLDLSSSEYFCFCDADDAFLENFLESALDFLLKENLDLVIGGVQTKDKNGQILENLVAKGEKIIFTKENMPLFWDYALSGKCRRETRVLGNGLVARPLPKIYCAHLRQRIRFLESLSMHEDNLYSFDIFSECSRIGVSCEIWYEYFQNDYSLTHSYNPKLFEMEILFANEVYKRKKNFPEEKSMEIRLALIFLSALAVLSFNKDNKEKSKKLKILFSEDCFSYLNWKSIRKDAASYLSFPTKDKLYISACSIKNTRIRNAFLILLMNFHNLLRGVKNVGK